ncbi:unnamed protein product [Echinostoma caproni]|uniref:Transmembrane protein n=1 Tax=Echinostoma caproni TaxID=27848 RepID=A0A183AUQ2_9TREM|nr:unnamed protein product [Echinostoma caproni]
MPDSDVFPSAPEDTVLDHLIRGALLIAAFIQVYFFCMALFPVSESVTDVPVSGKTRQRRSGERGKRKQH